MTDMSRCDETEQADRRAELRALCGGMKVSQRGIARMLELNEDIFRHMCNGHRPVTLAVLYAARYLRQTFGVEQL